MQVFTKPKLDQPASRPPIDDAFVPFASEARRALAHIRDNLANYSPLPLADSGAVFN
jgi:hypothetical protein